MNPTRPTYEIHSSRRKEESFWLEAIRDVVTEDTELRRDFKLRLSRIS